jgi:hypothetical protein
VFKRQKVSELLIAEDAEESGCGLILESIPAFALRDGRKPPRKAISVQAEIRTGNLYNTSQL